MAVRSKYTPKQRHTPRPSRPQPQQPPVQGTGVMGKAKQALVAAAKYIQQNQDAYRRSGGTTLDEDMTQWVRGACNKAGDFGDECRSNVRSSCRRDTDEEIFESVQGRRGQRQNPRFVVQNPRNDARGQCARCDSAPRTKPKPRSGSRVTERVIYIPERW